MDLLFTRLKGSWVKEDLVKFLWVVVFLEEVNVQQALVLLRFSIVLTNTFLFSFP